MTITEFVDVAKAFYPEGKEAKFVNGVLDHMARAARPGRLRLKRSGLLAEPARHVVAPQADVRQAVVEVAQRPAVAPTQCAC